MKFNYKLFKIILITIICLLFISYIICLLFFNNCLFTLMLEKFINVTASVAIITRFINISLSRNNNKLGW